MAVDRYPIDFKVNNGVELISFPSLPSLLQPAEKHVSDLGYQLLDVLGMVTATLEWRGCKSTQHIYVLWVQTAPLLGLRAIQVVGTVHTKLAARSGARQQGHHITAFATTPFGLPCNVRLPSFCDIYFQNDRNLALLHHSRAKMFLALPEFLCQQLTDRSARFFRLPTWPLSRQRILWQHTS